MHRRVDIFHPQSDARVAAPNSVFEDRLTVSLTSVGVPDHAQAARWDWLWDNGIDDELHRRAYGDD